MNTDLQEQVLIYLKDIFFIWDTKDKSVIYLSKEAQDEYLFLVDQIHPDDRSKFEFILRALSAENADQNFDFRGSEASWLNLKTFPIAGGPGEPVMIAGQLTDITELKNRCLKAEALVRHNEGVMRSMAHDIKNPVNVMTTGAQLAEVSLSREDIDEARSILKMIGSSGKRTFGLIQTMNHLIEYWSPDMEMKFQATDFARLVGDVVAEYLPAFQSKGIQLKAEIPAERIPVRIDPGKFRVAVRNLLENALQFTYGEGSVKVHVHVQDQTVRLQVHDTGMGIPKDKLDSIFEIFTPCRRAGTNGTSGTGVGLAIARKVLELHGGHIHARSDGQGSTFTLELEKLPEVG